MSDCINSEKPASGAAKNFPEERKKPSPVNQGKAGKRPHPALRATFPSQGKALYGAVQSCAKRKVCPCEEARRADVAPSAPFRGHLSHRERQGPHGYLSFCVCFWYTPFPGKCPVPTSGRSPALCPGTAAPTPPAAARRGRPGRPGADRSPPASGESGRAPCSGG